MRWGIYALILLALAGCGGETKGQAAWNACESITDYGAWSECFDRHMPRRERVQATQSSQTSDDDTAATLLLLGGSFLNGWNQGRDQEQAAMRQSTCQWLAGMLQCTSW